MIIIFQPPQLRELSDSDRAFLAELARAEALSLETARWDEIRRQTLRAGHHLGGQPAGNFMQKSSLKLRSVCPPELLSVGLLAIFFLKHM